MLKKLIFAAVIAFAAPAAAEACPDYDRWGRDIPGDNGAYGVVAGGSEDLSYCYLPDVGYTYGFVETAPDFTMWFEPFDHEAVVFETVATCDTILLVNTGNANYFFDDDDGQGTNAAISLRYPSTGWYDIWVGTYAPENCHADLYISVGPRNYLVAQIDLN